MLPSMTGAESEAAAAADTAAVAVTLDELVLADEPARWAALGFTVDDGVVQLATVRVRLAGAAAGRGIFGWSLRGLTGTDLDGLPSGRAAQPPSGAAPEHRNGVVAIDHVVAMTPDLDRSVRALQGAGLDLRRIREEPTPAGAPRQAFFRLGTEILEVVQEPAQVVAEHGGSGRPARLWASRCSPPISTRARRRCRRTPVRCAMPCSRAGASRRSNARPAWPCRWR